MNKDYIYKRRLLSLAEFLDKLPPERFYFGRWVGISWQGKSDLSCGTTACAFGWGTTIPALRKAGLRLGLTNHGFGVVHLKDKMPSENAPEEAAAKVFGLSKEDFDYLFFPYEETEAYRYGREAPSINASAKEVAKHIRNFVTHKYG